MTDDISVDRATKDSVAELSEQIKRECIFFSTESEPLTSSSGAIHKWEFDFRPLVLDGRSLNLLAELFWSEMSSFWPFQLAGLELAAVPMMAGIIVEGERRGLSTRALVVRKKRKRHGRGRIVEGSPDLDLPVVLVDDSLNSGRSLNQALVAIRELGLKTERAFVIAQFNSRQGRQWAQRNGVTVHNLVTPSDFGLKTANSSGYQSEMSLVWSFTAPRPNYQLAVPKSTPCLYRDSILFGSDSGIFWSLYKRSGAVKWQYATACDNKKGIVSSPVISAGRVYFGDYSGTLYCLNASTGEEKWTSKICDWIGSSPCHASGGIYVGLEYRDRTYRGGLAKFSASNGALIWEVPTAQLLHGSPVYSSAHNAVVVGTNEGTVLVINADTGEVIRLLNVGGAVKYHCAFYNNSIIFGSFDNNIYMWDFVNDCIEMIQPTGDIVYSRPLIIGARAYVGCADHTLRVFDLDQPREIMCLDMGEKVHSSPAIIGDEIFVGTSAGELVAFDAATLEITRRLQFPERLTNTLVGDEDNLYVYAYDNKMWAIKRVADL